MFWPSCYVDVLEVKTWVYLYITKVCPTCLFFTLSLTLLSALLDNFSSLTLCLHTLTPMNICAGAALPQAFGITLLYVLGIMLNQWDCLSGVTTQTGACDYGIGCQAVQGQWGRMLRTCPARLNLLLQFSDRFPGPLGAWALVSKAHLCFQAESRSMTD